jgi:hypothetical protein
MLHMLQLHVLAKLMRSTSVYTSMCNIAYGVTHVPRIQLYHTYTHVQVTSVSAVMDLSTLHGRIELVLTLTQIYRLLHLMSKCLPELEIRHKRHAVFSCLKRPYPIHR